MFSTEAAPETYTGMAIFDMAYDLYGVGLRRAFVQPHGCATVPPVFSVERLSQSVGQFMSMSHIHFRNMSLVTKGAGKKRRKKHLKVHYAG
jgi:hypothetical protein